MASSPPWVAAVVPVGADSLQVFYKLPDGTLRERLLGRADEGRVAVATVARPWSFDGDGEALKLTADRICEENELVITTWSPVHLRNRLRELYWKDGRTVAKAMTVWDDMQKYLYLPRLKSRSVFEQAIATGAAGTDFFGVAYGEVGAKLEGFALGTHSVQLDETLL
jgi:hypothetical protein